MTCGRASSQISDIEQLLSGQPPEDGNLASLAPILEALHRQRLGPPSEERVSAFAAQAVGIAGSTKSLASPAKPERTPIRPRTSQLASGRGLVKGAAGLVLLFGMSGVAIASDEAAPGDALYGLDRALEAVGVNDGAASERINEARALFDHGREADAVTHVADAIEEAETDQESAESSSEAAQAAGALRRAADSVQNNNDNPQSQEVRDGVAAMLTEMATMFEDPDFVGADFGERVSEMARSLAGQGQRGEEGGNASEDESESDDPDKGGGPPDGVPAGPPEGVNPGRPEGRPAGPPGGVQPGRPEGTPGHP